MSHPIVTKDYPCANCGKNVNSCECGEEEKSDECQSGELKVDSILPTQENLINLLNE